jgi:hypothetical protein
MHILISGEQHKLPPISYPLGLLFGVILVARFAIFPNDYGTDKLNYQVNFENLSILDLYKVRDFGFALYSFIIKQIIDDSAIYFTITAIIYVSGYFVFANRFIARSYVPFLLITCFCSLGFPAYAVNTIRGGLALSLLLVAISYNKKQVLFIALSVFAISCHKSVLLPLIGFIMAGFYKKPKPYEYFWLLCLFVSFLNIGFISNPVLGLLENSDDRFIDYFNDYALERYNAGFRLDFVIYSAIPILVGRYYIYKLKIEDAFYLRIFNTYLFANGIWLLVIRMAFTDRLAYLSWFLLPFILVYPILKNKLPINEKKWMVYILLVIFSFTSFLFFKQL